MIIRNITIKELPVFIDSQLYKGSQIIPITPERVVSQVSNPRAQPDDVVLVVAYTEEGQLAGFAGMLPDTGCSAEGPYRFAWNSGWWADAERGKGIALNLFFRSIAAWEGNFLITDMTPHTRRIVELTHLFYFADPGKGIRFQILSDFTGKLRRNYKSLMVFSGLFTFIDWLINSILRYRLSHWKKKKETEDLKIEYFQEFDEVSLNFIEKYSQHELCRRGKPEFGWIMSYPWLVTGAPDAHKGQYPFSRDCGHFEYCWAKIVYHGEIEGIVLFTNREGLFKIPYAYYDPGRHHLFSSAVCGMLIDRKASGFYTASREIVNFMEKNAFPVLHKKPFIQGLAVSRTLSQRHPENFFLQEGDGDAVFT